MAQKRSSSGLSLLIGIDKPQNMTSHDVVNSCRRIFGERRVGHTGTLDPLATGVLPVCIGPATRLDSYLVGHNKTYIASIAFGAATDTDDAEGDIIFRVPVSENVKEARLARACLARFVGNLKQTPPAYSAIKIHGKKACDEIRAGRMVELPLRDVTVFEAKLLDIFDDEATGYVVWKVKFRVSAGTYIRSLAHDIGNEMGCPAHISALRRTSVGALELDECISLDALSTIKEQAAIDPVRLLGFRVAFIKGTHVHRLKNGNSFHLDEFELFSMRALSYEERLCSCSTQLLQSCTVPSDQEFISVVCEGKLAGIYSYDQSCGLYKAKTIFAEGISRG